MPGTIEEQLQALADRTMAECDRRPVDEMAPRLRPQELTTPSATADLPRYGEGDHRPSRRSTAVGLGIAAVVVLIAGIAIGVHQGRESDHGFATGTAEVSEAGDRSGTTDTVPEDSWEVVDPPAPPASQDEIRELIAEAKKVIGLDIGMPCPDGSPNADVPRDLRFEVAAGTGISGECVVLGWYPVVLADESLPRIPPGLYNNDGTRIGSAFRVGAPISGVQPGTFRTDSQGRTFGLAPESRQAESTPGEYSEALPDFVAVTSRDGLVVAGYVPKTALFLQPESPVEAGDSGFGKPGTPVVGDDGESVVGHFVPEVGFVGLEEDLASIPKASESVSR